MTDNIIQKETHFTDLISTEHLINDADRLPGRDGTPGTGMKISEAALLAQSWWDTKARKMMPDFGKDPHEQVIKSGIMMGLPWFNLDKQEMLRVVAQWYANVGVHMIIEGRSSSDDSHMKKDLSGLRDDSAEVLPVLSSEGTHEKTSVEKELKIWEKEYEQIDLEDGLITEQGEKLSTEKDENDG